MQEQLDFVIFLILPKKTILGPITGGVYSGRTNNLNLFVRKYFFPIFGILKLNWKINIVKYSRCNILSEKRSSINLFKVIEEY